MSIPAGTSPERLLKERSRDLRPFNDQRPLGRAPISWFDERFSAARVEHAPMLGGISPERRFPARETDLRDLHCAKNPSGICPERLFSLRSTARRLARRESSGLKPPEKLFLERDKVCRDCSRRRPRPILPEREKPSKASSATRFVRGSHFTPTQPQGLSSSSFQEASRSSGSRRSALKTMSPRTSSLSVGSKGNVRTGRKRRQQPSTPRGKTLILTAHSCRGFSVGICRLVPPMPNPQPKVGEEMEKRNQERGNIH